MHTAARFQEAGPSRRALRLVAALAKAPHRPVLSGRATPTEPLKGRVMARRPLGRRIQAAS
jgi:hypothetical protein